MKTRFYWKTYEYNTPNDRQREIGVIQGLGDMWIVGWIKDNGSVCRVKTSRLPPCADPKVLQEMLDVWAWERLLGVRSEAPKAAPKMRNPFLTGHVYAGHETAWSTAEDQINALRGFDAARLREVLRWPETMKTVRAAAERALRKLGEDVGESENKTKKEDRAMAKKTNSEKVAFFVDLNDMVLDGTLQVRANMDKDTTAEYAQAMQEGATFPPVTLFDVGGQLLLVDGWHRHSAAQICGYRSLEANVIRGSREDALAFAIKANLANGLRYSNEDKRRVVGIACETWPTLSSRGIAQLCGVSADFVARLRGQLSSNDGSAKTTVTGRDGKQYPAKATRERDGGAELERKDRQADAKETCDADREDEDRKEREREEEESYMSHLDDIMNHIEGIEGLDVPNGKRDLIVASLREIRGRLDELYYAIDRS